MAVQNWSYGACTTTKWEEHPVCSRIQSRCKTTVRPSWVGHLISTGKEMMAVSRCFSISVFVVELVAVLAVLVVLSRFDGAGSLSSSSKSLSFQLEQGSPVFRILQLADLHLGENAWEDWGPRNDNKTFDALEQYFSLSSPIHLVVLSGDQLTANNVNTNATLYYQRLARFLNERAIPFATIFGNHDDAPLETQNDEGGIGKTAARTSRRNLMEVLQSYPFSVSRQGPPNIPGASNYWLDVTYGRATSLRLAFVDTGGGSLDKNLTQNHLDWFRDAASESSEPIVVFQHIPTAEFGASSGNCAGLREDGLDPVDFDIGWVKSLRQIDAVQLVAVGHNHGNDYCCDLQALSLCFGRHSGYGGYGTWERGARIYEFNLHEREVQWKSWVLVESGEVIDQYSPSV